MALILTFSATITTPSLLRIARTVPAMEMASIAYSTGHTKDGDDSA
jgi:hypothetical protein